MVLQSGVRLGLMRRTGRRHRGGQRRRCCARTVLLRRGRLPWPQLCVPIRVLCACHDWCVAARGDRPGARCDPREWRRLGRSCALEFRPWHGLSFWSLVGPGAALRRAGPRGAPGPWSPRAQERGAATGLIGFTPRRARLRVGALRLRRGPVRRRLRWRRRWRRGAPRP